MPDAKALVCAARDGRLAEVQRLLQEADGLKIDSYVGYRHKTAIRAAIKSGRVHIVRWLLQQGARFNATRLSKAYEALNVDWTSDRESIVRLLHERRASQGSRYEPFHDPDVFCAAVREGMEDVVRLLIRRGADVNAEESKSSLTPLMTALRFDEEPIVRILLNAGASTDQRSCSGLSDFSGQPTPLIFAASAGLATGVRLLLERGASVHEIDAAGKTALMHAARSSDLQTMTLLLNAGSPVNAQSSAGESALMLAARFRYHEEAVSLILKSGAAVDLVDHANWTALMHSTVDGGIETMRLLLEAGSPVDTQSDTGETALMLAIEPSDVKLLLDHGALINQVNHQGWTAVMIAAYRGNTESVRVLLDHGTSLDVQSGAGDTALTLAQKEDHESVICLLREYSVGSLAVHEQQVSKTERWGSLLEAATAGDDATALRLLEAKAPIDKQTSTGETALMRAVWNQKAQVVRLLIKYGANIALKDNKNWSALMKAAHIGNAEITRLLVETGASIDELGKDSESALMRASSKGHDEVVSVLIGSGANLNLGTHSWDKKGWTALTYAASEGFTSVVKLLIQAGATINFSGDDDNYLHTPLARAAGNGHEDVVRVLIAHGAHVNGTHNAHTTALECAAREGHEKIARLLIESGASVDQRDKYGYTALMCAAEHGREGIVAMLLRHSASVRKTDGKTALVFAAIKGHDDCARLLVQAGAFVDESDLNDKTALIWAAERGHEKCVRVLLQAGALVDHHDNQGQNALMLGAQWQRESCVRALLKYGARVDARSLNGDTALTTACRFGSEAIVRLLLSWDASTEAKCAKNRTALILTSKKGFDGIVSHLLQARALVNAKGSDGRSSLALAAKYGHYRVVETLLKSGASVDSADDAGKTPLMFASEKGYAEVVLCLLKSGANINATDHEQSTAIMLAVLKGHVHIVGLLRDHGAALDIRNKNGFSVLMLAANFGDNSVMRELLAVESVLQRSISYLQAGMPAFAAVIEPKNLSKLHQGPKTSVDMLECCSGMLGASDICHYVVKRLSNVEKQLNAMTKIAQRKPMKGFMQISERMRLFLEKYSRKPTVIHLVSSEQIVNTCRDINLQLDELILEHSLSSNADMLQFDGYAQSYMLHIQDSTRLYQETLFDELRETDAQQEALMLLLFECGHRVSKYTEKEMDLMHQIFCHVSSFSKLGISSIPEWFVPPQDVEVDGEFASGSFGSVHSGRWNGAEVVVKSAFLLDAHNRTMFMNEVDIWHKLLHPNVIQLYKACHVGNPFFVCEYAENGTLSDFLYRKKDPKKTWEKLFEAARGLRYLHEEHKVVHGDLKCNNILVGGTRSSDDGPAKLTDFGLSFKLSLENTDLITEEVGAIQWKAPEVIEGNIRGSFASDVYSFGMCILEAAKGGLPWGNFPDATIKYKLLKAKNLPSRPANVYDTQWELISSMIAWESSERPLMREVVNSLEEIMLEYSVRTSF